MGDGIDGKPARMSKHCRFTESGSCCHTRDGRTEGGGVRRPELGVTGSWERLEP